MPDSKQTFKKAKLRRILRDGKGDRMPNPKCLVVVRAGGGSLHRSWCAPHTYPQFDVLVSYYGDGTYNPRPGELVHYYKGGKWEGLFDLFMGSPDLLSDYAYIWLPDDDLEISATDINRLFAIAEKRELEICQPSLTWESYFSYFITLQNLSFELRYTNFVELMAPLFSANALRTVLPLFNGARFGWGLDRIWARLLPNPEFTSAIVDAVAVKHLRGGLTGSLYSQAVSGPRDEERRLLSRLGIDCSSFKPVAYAGINAMGTNVLTGFWLRYNLYMGWRGIRSYPHLHPQVSRKTRKVRRNSRLCVEAMPDLAPIFAEGIPKEVLVAQPAENT